MEIILVGFQMKRAETTKTARGPAETQQYMTGVYTSSAKSSLQHGILFFEVLLQVWTLNIARGNVHLPDATMIPGADSLLAIFPDV